ncbi:head-tail connector protein [Psychrobacter sp. WY6]|uniref:head-tail connector protein n=1 Tax=Psychrobacter sp. WY6 TaxID=2708350 RepID=UPI00202309DF|nr:head-tail connector protein [Psychrobacter sp. WY6]
MTNWVTLEEAKYHLRYDDDSNDMMLQGYIAAAEAATNRYITESVVAEDTPDIKVAVLLLVGYYDYHRNMDKDMPSDGNYLPPPVRALLWPYRKPSVN